MISAASTWLCQPTSHGLDQPLRLLQGSGGNAVKIKTPAASRTPDRSGPCWHPAIQCQLTLRVPPLPFRLVHFAADDWCVALSDWCVW